MRALAAAGLCLALAAGAAQAADDFLDAVDDALSVSAWHDAFRARISGAADLEAYRFQPPPPGLIVSDGTALADPRLSLFLDAQVGPQIYVFAEARLDRGFDPGNGPLRGRLDEYAARLTPWDDGRFSLQVGKFATVVGNWTPRHDSWDNPFVTAPLPYENLTGVWDVEAARTAGILQLWSSAGPNPSPEFPNKARSVPVIWGPSYASGASASGLLSGKFQYAVEVKNASLSSRPDTWSPSETRWGDPTFSARIGWVPDARWDFGLSASTGGYLRPSAAGTLAPGASLADYRETVFGQDASFAWHHLQLWAEAYEARFAIPRVGQADTLAYYAEGKLQLTPQLFGALRWNQQFFSAIPFPGGGSAQWGSGVWRIDAGPGYRFTPHTQAKVQYSFQRQDSGLRKRSGMLATQLTARF